MGMPSNGAAFLVIPRRRKMSPSAHRERVQPPRNNPARAKVMSALTRALLWSPVQVTVLALAAIVIGAIVGRRRPSAGALVAAAALVAMVGLTAAALSPWPAWDISWEWLPRHHPIATSDGKPEQPAIAATAKLPAQAFDDPRDFEQPLKGRSTTGHEPAGLL